MLRKKYHVKRERLKRMARAKKRKTVFESSKYKLPIKSEDIGIGPGTIAKKVGGVVLKKGIDALNRRNLIAERSYEAAQSGVDLEPKKKKTPAKPKPKANVDIKGKSTIIKVKPKQK